MLCLFCLFLFGVQVLGVSEQERAALGALQRSFSAPGWSLPPDQGCQWKGIYCQNNSVIGISLSHLPGPSLLPPQIGQLINLKTLQLQNISLAGTLPTQIGLTF